jgi:hypothetical protein
VRQAKQIGGWETVVTTPPDQPYECPKMPHPGVICSETIKTTEPEVEQSTCKLYHVFTQADCPDCLRRALAIAQRHFRAFAYLPVHGFWQGKPEESVDIMVCTSDANKVRAMAEEIKRQNAQEEVLVA